MKSVILSTVLVGSTLAAQTLAPPLKQRVQPYLDSARAAGSAFVSISAASGMPNLSPDSLATAIGSNLAARTEVGTAPYPTTLGGISLQVVDSAGAIRLAPLLYVSPQQVNYLIPASTLPGSATMNIVDSSGNSLSSTAQIQTVAPGLFTANEDGMGVVAATAYHTIAPGTRQFPVQVYQCLDRPGTCKSVPIDLGIDTPTFVDLFMTGLRGRSNDSAVTLTIGSQTVAIDSITDDDDAGAAAGIDEVLVGLPLSLRGSGEVNVVISVDGKTSNTARINIQ